MSTVLVLGGTGMLGAPTVHHLRDGGARVRLLTRRPDAAAALFPHGVDVVSGDGADPDAMRAAMAGCDGVFLSVAGPGDRRCAENAAAAAPRLGLGHVTYVSGTTVREEHAWFPMVADKLAAERAVMGCGVPWTVLRPSWCMEQLPNFLRHAKPVVIGRLETRWHFYAPRDLGRMAAATFSRPAAEGRCLFVHGPVAMTIREAVERLVELSCPERGRVRVLPIWMAKLVARLTRDDLLRHGADLMAYFREVGEDGDPAEANAILGAPRITLEQWVEERSAVPA